MIKYEILNNEKILNFLIEPQMVSGPDPLRIDDPAQIASELRNRSARPEPGRAGPVKTIRPEPCPAHIRPG